MNTEMGSSSGILSPGATAGVAIGLLLLLSLGVMAVVSAMVCLVRHRRPNSDKSSTLWVSSRDGLNLGKGNTHILVT